MSKVQIVLLMINLNYLNLYVHMIWVFPPCIYEKGHRSCVHINLYIYIYIYTHTHTYIHVCVCIYLYINVFVYTCVHVFATTMQVTFAYRSKVSFICPTHFEE